MDNRLINFYKRWNIEYDEKKQFDEFKNRILCSIDKDLGRVFIDRPSIEERYIRLIGILPKKSFSTVYKPGFADITNILKFSGHTLTFHETKVWSLLFEISNFIDLVKCIQAVFWIDNLDKDLVDNFYNSVKEDIDISGVQINLKRVGDGYILYPKGSKMLDKKVVNEVLEGLSKFPNSLKHFSQALRKYLEKKYERNLIDDLRLSLELFLKEFLKNSKPLEKQQEAIGIYLKKNNFGKELSNMYTTLINYYSKYQNEYVKHNDKLTGKELEFLIYLTGVFIRLLLTLENKNG